MFAQIVLLLGLAGWGIVVAVSLRPLRRPHKIAMGFYRFIYRTTELPQVLALLAVTSVAPLFLIGDVSGGWLTLTLLGAALVSLGVVAMVMNAARSWSAMDRGLLAAGLEPSRRRRSWWSVVVRPFINRPASVELISDLPYGDHVRQRLDLYRRVDGSVDGPVLIYFHSGGYFTGDKSRAGRPLLHHLAERGWLCVSANYRLRPEAGMPEHLADARSAITWAREHAAEYGADPSAVVLAGSSAGAHLATLCALTPVESTRVDGLICVYGWFLDYAEYFRQPQASGTPTSPFGPDPAAAPPALLVNGSADVLASAQTARDLAARLAGATPGPVVTVTLPGAQHSFDAFDTWRAQALVDGVDVFVDSVLGDLPTSND